MACAPASHTPPMRYSLDPVRAECPACHSNGASHLHRVGSVQSAQHFARREVAPERHEALRDHIEELWGGDACDVLRCNTCGFGFARPYVAGDARFYDLAYERTGYPQARWEFGRTVEALAGVAPGYSLLEVGAGDGAFLRRVVGSLMPPDRALATEFSEYGRRAIESLGVRAVAADVRSLDGAAPAPFGAVCLFQVLEHLDGLDELMAHLGALSTPDAHLFISVPNDARIEFSERHGGLLDMPPNHVGRWTRSAFQFLAKRHGWRLVGHEVEPEGALAKMRELVVYRYMRRRQRGGSLAARAERVRPPLVRAAQGAALAAYAVGALPAAAAMVRADGLGGTQWAHLRRRA